MNSIVNIKKTYSIFCILFLSTTSCHIRSNQEFYPAIITKPSVTATKEISDTISQLLNNAPVEIAKNAFTKTDILHIRQRDNQNIQQQNLLGRDMSQPIILLLQKNAQSCFIFNQNTQKRKRLLTTSCELHIDSSH